MTKDQILTALPSLKKTDLQAVKAVCAALLGEAPKNAPTAMPSLNEALLFEALCVSTMVKMPFQRFAATLAYVHWQNHSAEALGFVENAFGSNFTNKVSYSGLLRFLIGMLIADMKVRKVPVTMQSVIVNFGRLPEVFDNGFPGYLANQSAMLIMSALVKERKHGMPRRNAHKRLPSGRAKKSRLGGDGQKG